MRARDRRRPPRSLGTARRARHVRGRDRESGLSAHLPQRGPTAASTGEITIFGPKIVGASTKAVFQQWWPSTQRASPSCARHLAVAAGATFPFLGRADARRRDATGAAEDSRFPIAPRRSYPVPAFSAGKHMLYRKDNPFGGNNDGVALPGERHFEESRRKHRFDPKIYVLSIQHAKFTFPLDNLFEAICHSPATTASSSLREDKRFIITRRSI